MVLWVRLAHFFTNEAYSQCQASPERKHARSRQNCSCFIVVSVKTPGTWFARHVVQKLGRWKTMQMVMRYAHHYPESLRAGIEILDRIPAGVSTVLAHSADSAAESVARESTVSW